MPDYDVDGLALQKVYTGPDGNLSRHVALMQITRTTTRAAGDREFIAPLPQGMMVHDVRAIIEDGQGAASNIDVGHVQKGEGSWADDPDYFLDGQSIQNPAAVSSLFTTRHAPLKITAKDVFLTATFNAAIPNNQDVRIRFYIDYEYIGTL